jgi:chorismate--pyruvate lyase|tara:strand:- start:2893 stop:3534 length:642 start_codon:yes stop_codon:yes gene_type:complete
MTSTPIITQPNIGTALPISQPSPITSAIPWQALSEFDHKQIPAGWYEWLSDRGSLTARLVDASENTFSVEVLNQYELVPSESEAAALDITTSTPAIIREVILWGKGKPWVFARSVLPLTTLTGRLAALRELDSQPLGALLFSDPSMTRAPVEASYSSASAFVVPNTQCAGTAFLWGRRSIFYLDQKPLLVSEMFLPSFEPYTNMLSYTQDEQK